jgi:WD40 repeat protein
MCRVEFSPDSRCVWALASMPQVDTDSDTGPTSKQPDNSGSSSGSSSILCFSVAVGSLLQQLPQPHGTAAVSSFCLDAAGRVLATCGSDHLVKLWSVASSSSSGSGIMPVCQSFTAHHGAVAGTLKTWQLLLVGGMVVVVVVSQKWWVRG